MTTDSSPAEAFEVLRREVALLRRALEGLAAEQKAQPDYSGILAGIGARIKEQNAVLGAMAKTPALQLTREAMGQQITHASQQVRAEDARLLGYAQNRMTSVARQIEAALATARTTHAQQHAVRWSAIIGIVIGAIVGAACGVIATNWNTPYVASTGEGRANNSGLFLIPNIKPHYFDSIDPPCGGHLPVSFITPVKLGCSRRSTEALLWGCIPKKHI